MSLGFGKVAPDQWAARAAGGRADKVPVADYFAKVTEVVHFDPSKSEKGLGTYIVRFSTTEANAAEWQGKTLEFRGMYHPAPTTDGYTKMNEITENHLIQLIAAAGVEPQADAQGAYDIIATLNLLPTVEATVVGGISHRQHEGKEFQDFGNFRPAS